MSNIPKNYSRLGPQGTILDDTLSGGTKHILSVADQLGIQYREIPGTQLFELKYQSHIEYFHRRVPSTTSYIGYYSTLDKNVTKLLLRDKGISVTDGYVIRKTDNRDYWTAVFDTLKKPLVVKPTHASNGEDVFLNVTHLDQYLAFVERAFATRPFPDAGVIVEETFVGKEYRLLVSKDAFIGAMHRVPGNVVGDGTATVQTLIEEKNKDPQRKNVPNSLYYQIAIDDEAIRCLAEQHLTLESVPEPGQTVFLRHQSNLSQGGDGIDVTDQIHPSVKDIALQTIRALPGLSWAGIDFMTKDVTQPQTPETYTIIEVNYSPELAIHDKPLIGGQNRHAAEEFLRLMFPELSP